MKKIIFALLAIFACMSAKAADVTGALTNVADPTITYQSVDAFNREITLSARLYYKDNKNVEFVMLNCHPTITHNSGAPTGSAPQMEVVKYMVSESCLLICPDYIGFGETSSTTHPYMCATLTARNLLDCYKAAIKYVKETGGRTINEDYYTINVGYSQGGATALAFQRYLETEATDEDRALVNLRGSVCGAGPYDQNIVFDTYEKWCENSSYKLDYPIYLFYVLNGHKAAFGESVMRGLELQDCFTENFWNYYQSTLKTEFEAKEKNVDDLNKMLKGMGFDSFYKIISEDYKDHSSKVYRTIHKTLEQSNLLADGWTPKDPIIFYHDSAGNDIVVPYACTEAALTRFAGHCTYVDAVDDYTYNRGDNYLWHPAAFREIWDNMWTWPGQNTIMGLAGITGNESYKFSQLDHRTFGARFYVQFLAGRACMRPAAPTTPTQGTAHNSNIDIATPYNQEISASGTSVDGYFDRIEMQLSYPMVNGLTLMQFPAKVDGYYFGADAERYEVILNDEGEAVSYREMDDLEDFVSGKVYAIKSNGAEESVVSMKAGVRTEAATSDLTWRELNYRKLNSLGGKSYASAYLPFGYKAAEGADIYLVKESESEGFVTATKTEAGVSAGTGTLLISHSNAPLAVLEPDIQGEAGTEKGILTGCYSETANDPDHFLLFGKSNKGNVGFWKYTTETIRPYSAFLINSSVNEAKGVEIALSEDTDAIRLIDSKEAAQGIYGIDGTKRNALQHGVNLLRNTNGSVRKVIKK